MQSIWSIYCKALELLHFLLRPLRPLDRAVVRSWGSASGSVGVFGAAAAKPRHFCTRAPENARVADVTSLLPLSPLLPLSSLSLHHPRGDLNLDVHNMFRFTIFHNHLHLHRLHRLQRLHRRHRLHLHIYRHLCCLLSSSSRSSPSIYQHRFNIVFILIGMIPFGKDTSPPWFFGGNHWSLSSGPLSGYSVAP